MNSIKIKSSPTFTKIAKKLHAKHKAILDENILAIAKNPHIGTEKKGDLVGVFVHKFKINKQQYLLAYILIPSKNLVEEIVLISLGSHENFYDNLK
ncbi:MAG: hypothetical protein RLZZ210_1714 [Pseudomonadota bacterium]|jgi:mRNA-degrading endonuclease RelE of RelBE toxin-antitoxin system